MLKLISRDEAHYQGLKRFYTGVPCLRGHNSERFTSNGGCVECINRKTPRKTKSNGFMFWPAGAVSFAMCTTAIPSQAEADAVFKALEAWGWQYKVARYVACGSGAHGAVHGTEIAAAVQRAG